MTSIVNTRQAFAKALRQCRVHKGLTQEDFGEKSSRTYVSTLERGLKSPTLEKIDDLAGVMHIHPMVLLLLTYAELSDNLDTLCEEIKKEVAEISSETD